MRTILVSNYDCVTMCVADVPPVTDPHAMEIGKFVQYAIISEYGWQFSVLLLRNQCLFADLILFHIYLLNNVSRDVELICCLFSFIFFDESLSRLDISYINFLTKVATRR